MKETVSYVITHIADVVPATIEALKRDPEVQIRAISERTSRAKLRAEEDMHRRELAAKMKMWKEPAATNRLIRDVAAAAINKGLTCSTGEEYNAAWKEVVATYEIPE